jgi:hypothetical protein
MFDGWKIEMEAWQQRVIDEQSELSSKIEKILAFIGGKETAFASLETAEQDRLMRQMRIMTSYYDILDERIKHF